MNPYGHINLWYVLLAIVFLAILSYMFLYNKRSKSREHQIEGGHAAASKEAGILEAQEAMRHDKQHHR